MNNVHWFLKRFNQNELSDLTRYLNLPKETSELLVAMLNGKTKVIVYYLLLSLSLTKAKEEFDITALVFSLWLT